MAATVYWVSTNGDVTDTNSYSSSSGGPGGTGGGAGAGGIPGATDTLIFDRGLIYPTTNLGGLSGTLAHVAVYEGFGYGGTGIRFGDDSGAAFDVDATLLTIVNRRLQYARFSGAFATVRAQALGQAHLMFSSGSVTTCYLPNDGRCTFGVDVDLTTGHSAGCGLTLEACPTSPQNLQLKLSKGCVAVCRRLLQKASIGGTLRLEAAATVTSSADIDINNGGVLDLQQQGGAVGSGTVTVMNGGTLTAASALAPFTFTATVVRHTGGRVNVPTNIATLSIVEAGSASGLLPTI